MKNDFYKSFHEIILKGIVDRQYNDRIGGIENHYYDTDELNPIRKSDLISEITSFILRTKSTLFTENGYGLEPKHIRFMGKARVTEIVEHRVNYRYAHEEFPQAFVD